MRSDGPPPAATSGSRVPRPVVAFAALAIVAVLAMAAPVSAQAPLAGPSERGPRLLHLPMRWCVLEGTAAAAADPNAAVLERIRRGSSLLAPATGITLRGALDRVLARSAGFPVIRDPRTSLGRRGDVRIPIGSSGEYRLIVQHCADAWRRLARAARPGSDLGGVARGPVAVIIRSFVGADGRAIGSIWGYAFSASTSGDYCDARRPRVSSASGGSLMVIDSSDGAISAVSDRRLVAHEVGHILRLGHGNGLDDPGSIPGRIDKFCDPREDPDVVPGSLMSASLRYDRVTPWQTSLPRTVAASHPSTVADQPRLVPRSEIVRWLQLERIANGGHRLAVRTRRVPVEPMSPLPWLRSAGWRGSEAADDIRDQAGPASTPAGADLEAVGVAVDEETGDVSVSVRVRGDLEAVGSLEVATFGDGDGDPTTGGLPGGIADGPDPAADELVGIDFVVRATVAEGVAEAAAWRWDASDGTWLDVVPPPIASLDGSFGEADDDVVLDTLVIRLGSGSVALADTPALRTVARSSQAGGRSSIDVLPGEPGDAVLEPLDVRVPEYPVCAVERTAPRGGVVEPGSMATLEVYGFGETGQVRIWLADRPEPIAMATYEEMADDPWPWITQVRIPEDAEASLQMVQVTMDGRGATADCPLLVGDAPLPDFPDPGADR